MPSTAWLASRGRAGPRGVARARLRVVAVVTEDEFYVPARKAVYRARVELADRGQPIDIVTLETQVRAADDLDLVGRRLGVV